MIKTENSYEQNEKALGGASKDDLGSVESKHLNKVYMNKMSKKKDFYNGEHVQHLDPVMDSTRGTSDRQVREPSKTFHIKDTLCKNFAILGYSSELGPHPCWWKVRYQQGLLRPVFTSW